METTNKHYPYELKHILYIDICSLTDFVSGGTNCDYSVDREVI